MQVELAQEANIGRPITKFIAYNATNMSRDITITVNNCQWMVVEGTMNVLVICIVFDEI